jgi:acetyltransferase-like isoleucine patch superfamily enzyme
MISNTAIIYPNVKLGRDCVIEDFSVIGVPPAGSTPGELETIIGEGAVIRSHVVIYAGNRIGAHFHAGNKANIRELNDIADHVSIGTLSVVEHHVKIGTNVRIHSQAFIPEYTVLDPYCWIGPKVVITNSKYPLSPGAKHALKGAHVMSCAIVGANATLLPGIIVGKYALVGAGSVVTKNVGDRQVVVGNPARTIKQTSDLPYELADRDSIG